MTDKILIIGGGTGGLAMALFLEKAGIPCEIYEQAPEFSNVGASYAVHPNGVHVVEQLGLSEQLSEVSHSLDNYIFKNKDGDTVYDIKDQFPDSPFLDGLIYVSRYDLIDILYQEIKRREITINYSKKLKDLRQDDESVTAYFEDGTKATGSLLIGADGTHSKTRELIFPYEYLRYNGKWAVFGMAEEGTLGAAEQFMQQDDLISYFKDDFNFTISKHHPSRKERLSWVFIQNQERKVPKKYFDEKPADVFKDELAAKFSDFKEPIGELIRRSSTFFPTQVYSAGNLPKFSFKRVALIGDALQTTDPYSGMGATLSLEDGLYLAMMLRDHSDYKDAFYYYEFDRKETVRGIHNEAAEMENLSDEEIDQFLKKMSGEALESSYLNPPKINWEDRQ